MKLDNETKRLIFEHGIPSLVEVASPDDAIELAVELQRAGKYDLFRGQANAQWRVASSAERAGASKQDEVLQTFTRFWQWAKGTPEMEQYLTKPDELWAIAQHYGIKTQFIDFTDDPSIAGFFALDVKEPDKGQMASIICLNSDEFREFWKGSGYGAHQLQKLGDESAPEIVRIDVTDLWRLQKQAGCFLWNPLPEIERIYDFDRIVFPITADRNRVPSRDEIYPTNQSRLERLLTDYFVTERMRTNDAWIKSQSIFVQYNLKTPEGYHDGLTWLQREVHDDESWQVAGDWRIVPSENAHQSLPGWIISAPGSIADVVTHLTDQFVPVEIAQRRKFGLTVVAEQQSNSIVTTIDCIKKQWNGMRLLPYSDQEIADSLRKTLDMLSRKFSIEELESDDNAVKDRLIYVEFSEVSLVSQAYSRADVSSEALGAAFSAAFVEAAKAHLGSNATVREMMGLPCRPRYRFSYSGLRALMVLELIPSQIATRGTRVDDERMYETLIYSPANLDVFGLP